MVDTIALRITNLMQYQWIGEVLDLSLKKQGITVMNVEDVPGDYQNKIATIKEIRYNDTGKRKVMYTNKIYLKSSHYYLSYKIDDVKDCIDFNFSIPKYLYGSNIIQFVPHITDRKNTHARSDLENFEYIQKITFQRLMSFLDGFLNRLKYTRVEFGKNVTYSIDKLDVEIVRLDLCFNQYFDNKDDSLDYLKYQKRVKKSYIRDTSKNKTDWGTSIFLQTNTYVAKIYHKGKEYSSSTGERKHHEQINKNARKEIFPVFALQDEADKILRYEISFKNGYMSRIYKKKVFRKKDAFHASLKSAYQLKKSIDSKIDTMDIHLKKMLVASVDLDDRDTIIEKYNAEKKRLKIQLFTPIDFLRQYQVKIKGVKNETITIKQGAMLYNQMLNQTNCFMLGVTEAAQNYNEKTLELDYDRLGCVKLHKEAVFDARVFVEMSKVFKAFIKEFQLTERLQLDQVGLNIQNYNKHVDAIKDLIPTAKISEGPLARIAALMEHYTIDEMVSNGIISKRTKYDIIKKLELIDFHKGSILPKVIRTNVNFSQYHFERNNAESFNAVILN